MGYQPPLERGMHLDKVEQEPSLYADTINHPSRPNPAYAIAPPIDLRKPLGGLNQILAYLLPTL